MAIFTGSFLDAHGGERVFHLEARDFDEAEELLERIACSGRIDGQLLEEGEAERPFPIGNA
ncbi:MAG: hypothetical protein ACK4YQ_09740 [Phenylobacterium sp.]|uniref:hypothetical protein n=1 Tax=Phenylobacterium sp. TaxID=1871053 RepID=UPI0039188C4A